MAAIVFAFVYKYFFIALITFAVGIFTKALVKQFGNDRANKIKETILSSMLWAEQEFGIGHGNEKWEAAWKKIFELLKAQRITLKFEEESVVGILMKSKIPEINTITYSALPEEALQARKIKGISPEVTAMIDKLKEKHPK